MHRKVKGLLSLILTFAMVTATAAPVSADELSGEPQPIEEQPIVEAIEVIEEIEETESVPEQNMAEPENVQEPVAAEPENVPAEVQPGMEVEPTEPIMTEAEPASEQEQSIAQPIEAETAPAEQNVPGVELVSALDTNLDYLYDNLTEDQRQFRVYAGTDISSNLTFMDNGVTPDAENLTALGGTILETLLAGREGDLNFYRLSGWKLWKVDSDGALVDIQTTSHSPILSTIATKANFVQSANMVNNGTGTSPVVICQKPILEPVWSCLPYAIPVYDKDGNDTGTTMTVTAENYNSIAFPTMEADGWKLIYNGTEYRLDAASEIWTNETNGIRAVGKYFAEAQAKLQAFMLQEGTAEFAQPDWYEGYPKSAPIVSSETNGVENITYYYKEAGADDSTYTTVEPGRAGAYTVMAVFAATADYKEVFKTADFQILPVQAVLQEGTAEFTQPGWRVGETMPAPIVASETNGVDHITYYYKDQGADDYAYTTTVPTQVGKYTAKAVFAATELYMEVIKTSDFEILPSVEAIDGTAPVISGVSDGMTYFGDQAVTVTDENLRSVTVNGVAVEISDNRADIILKPSDDVYRIAAEDMSGNQTQYTVEVWETWVRDGISTNGKKKLRNARLYKLGSGQWTIDGDSTVYQGGRTFYVKNGGEYDFKKK